MRSTGRVFSDNFPFKSLTEESDIKRYLSFVRLLKFCNNKNRKWKKDRKNKFCCKNVKSISKYKKSDRIN